MWQFAIETNDILFASFLWLEVAHVASQSVRQRSGISTLRQLPFWISPQGRSMPMPVMHAFQMKRRMPCCRTWMVSLTMAYVLVLQLVLVALSSAGHAAARVDPAAPLHAAILCSMPGRSASSLPDAPASAKSDACASFCTPLQPQPSGSTAAAEIYRWQLPIPVVALPEQPSRLKALVLRAQQPRAPPA